MILKRLVAFLGSLFTVTKTIPWTKGEFYLEFSLIRKIADTGGDYHTLIDGNGNLPEVLLRDECMYIIHQGRVYCTRRMFFAIDLWTNVKVTGTTDGIELQYDNKAVHVISLEMKPDDLPGYYVSSDYGRLVDIYYRDGSTVPICPKTCEGAKGNSFIVY